MKKDVNWKKMKDVESNSWNKMFEVTTKARTINGIIRAIKKSSDLFECMTRDEMVEFVKSEFVEICDDGIIVWEC